MARTSRKNIVAPVKSPPTPKTEYSAALYARISVEDERKREADTIGNQIQLLRDFAGEDPDISVFDVYCDDDVSGTDFQRPEFSRMMNDIRDGKVNCVIVKDLSRLGREYIETGKYLETVFPDMGIRFISVNDDLDSEHTPLCDDISIPIKNIMNEAYCRSLSQKLRAQFRVQRKAGEFLGAFACYGYLKDPADKHKLIIDEYAAMVVRTIFQLKMEGYSQQAIANYLSSEGVLPPAAYKQQQGLKYQSGFQAVGDNIAWSPVAVRAILENPIYIGTLVQGKRGTPNYKIKQMKLRSKEDWCVVEKNHVPIISEELFTSVQHLLSLDTRTSPSEEVVQPLAGMLYCADCGRAMCRRSVKRGNRMFYYYVCSTHKRSKLCSSHSISQTALEDVVLRAIQKQIEMVVDIDQLIHEIGQKSIQAAKHRQLDMTIEEKEKRIAEQKEYRMRLLEAFHDDLISRAEYDMMRQRYTQRIDALQAALVSLRERRQALEEGAADTRNWVAEYTKFRKIDRLTREMVAGLIRRITVSEGKQITIQFNYADELASYQQMIAAAAKEVG